jgi:2-aminoadipate transaminase
VFSFAGGLPANETFPRATIAAAAEDAILALGGGSALQYDWPEGRGELREFVAARLRHRGADAEAGDVVITSGAQDAIAIAIEVLDPLEVQVDPLTYPGALELFRSRHCHVVTSSAAVRYAMPAIANPTGLTATWDERERILGARFIVEDDAYADLDLSGLPPERPLIAHARERVFHVGTFSKTLLPGLRVGWIVPPRPWLRRVREAKMRRDLHTSGLSQAIVERFLRIEDFAARLDHLHRFYARRCTRMCAALGRVPHLRFAQPRGGFSVWVETERPIDPIALLTAAISIGVAFDPGLLFDATPSCHHTTMRLSFSAMDEDSIEIGVERLARTLERSLARPRLCASGTEIARRSIIMKAKTSKPRRRAKARKAPSTRRWSQRVTEGSNALDLERGVFSKSTPRKVASSLKRSAERSARRKSPPYRSAMSMLSFYINRAGRKLAPARLRILERAKTKLRELFAKKPSHQ